MIIYINMFNYTNSDSHHWRMPLVTKMLSRFSPPPCQPPTGKDILERFFDILFNQPKNRQDKKAAAYSVALELID